MKVNILLSLQAMLNFTSCEDSSTYSCDNSNPNRIGTVCNDETKNSSVGSNTCSGQGGVNYWLCD